MPSVPRSAFPAIVAVAALGVAFAVVSGRPLPLFAVVALLGIHVTVAMIEIAARLRGGNRPGLSVLPRFVLAALASTDLARRDHESALKDALQRERVAVLGEEMRVAAMVEARREVELLNEELEAFTFSVSHDLAVPLRTMAAFVELLEASDGDRLGEEGREFLSRIASLARRMQSLVADLLVLSRMRSATGAVPAHVSIGAVAEEAAGDVEAALGRRFRLRVVGGDEEITAPKERLHAILQNLIHNGVKYNEREMPTIEVITDGAESFVSILVVDDGVGVPEDERDRVFDLFVRGTNHLGLDGTGAGLAIVRRAARSLGGDAWLEHSGPGGTTFCVSLPRDGGSHRRGVEVMAAAAG